MTDDLRALGPLDYRARALDEVEDAIRLAPHRLDAIEARPAPRRRRRSPRVAFYWNASCGGCEEAVRRSRRGARRAAREGGGGALAGRARLQAPRRRGAARRRDRRRVPERRGPAHRAGRVGAAAPAEGARSSSPSAPARTSAAWSGSATCPSRSSSSTPPTGCRRRSRTRTRSLPGQRVQRGGARPLPPGPPLPHAAARRGGAGGLRHPGLPAVAGGHRRGGGAAPRRRPAAARRGARAERRAVRDLPAQGLEAGADRDRVAAPARDDARSTRSAASSRRGSSASGPARARAASPAASRSGCRAAAASGRSTACETPGAAMLSAFASLLAGGEEERAALAAELAGSGGDLLAVLVRGGPRPAAAAAREPPPRRRRRSRRRARTRHDAPDHHRPDHAPRGARPDRGAPRRAGERADRVPASPGAARLRAVLRRARGGGDAAAHRPRLRGLPGGAPPRLGAGARRALRRDAAGRGAPDPGALLQPLPVRGPPPPLLVPRRPGLLRRSARARRPMRNVLGVIAKVGAELGGRHPLGPQGGARPHGGDRGADDPPGVRAARAGSRVRSTPETIRRVREAAPRLVRFAEDTLESFRGAVLEDRDVREGDRQRGLPRPLPLDGHGRRRGPAHVPRRAPADRGPRRRGARALRAGGVARPHRGAGRAVDLREAHVPRSRAAGRGSRRGRRAASTASGRSAGSTSRARWRRTAPSASGSGSSTQLGWPAHQTLAFHWARLVEALQAAETVEQLAHDPELASREVRNVPAPLTGPREGVGAVEAPRGTLIHHYGADADGILTAVNLVVASQHNGASVQVSVRKAARGLIRNGQVDDGLLNLLEMAFRAYDPCNACASHALPGELPLVVTLRGPDGAVREVIRRRVRTTRREGPAVILVLCLGNALRRDDAVALRVADLLEAAPPPGAVRPPHRGVRALPPRRDGGVRPRRGRRRGAHRPPRAGTVLSFPLEDLRAPEGPSPHSIGLPSVLARAKAAGAPVPSRIHVVAVEVLDMETVGEGLTPAVERGGPRRGRRGPRARVARARLSGPAGGEARFPGGVRPRAAPASCRRDVRGTAGAAGARRARGPSPTASRRPRHAGPLEGARRASARRARAGASSGSASSPTAAPASARRPAPRSSPTPRSPARRSRRACPPRALDGAGAARARRGRPPVSTSSAPRSSPRRSAPRFAPEDP